MSYNNNYNNYNNQYYNNGNNYPINSNPINPTNPTNPASPTSPTSSTSPTRPYMNEGYYNYQGSPPITSTSNYFPTNQRVQDLSQRNLTKIDTENHSTRSLGGATAVGTPHVYPTRNADDVDSINSHQPYQPYQPGAYNQYNHQDQTVTTNDTTVLQRQSLYGNPQHVNNVAEESEEHSSSFPDSTKRESTTQLTSTLLMEKNLGDTRDQHYHNYNQSNGYYPQNNNYYRQNDPYYNEESSRHNTLTSGYPNSYGVENDYTDRDFPGGGKNALQSMSGENFILPEKKRKRCGCCGCCSWTICLFVTLIILTGLGISGFFVWPRTPKVNIKEGVPVSQPNLSTNPPFIQMQLNMIVEIDNRENYVPYKFNKIDVAVFDRSANNDKSIATGSKPDYTLRPKIVDTIEFPLTVNYTAKNAGDPVIQDFISACSPDVKPNTPLKLKVDVELFVWGIDWIYKPKISVPIPDVKCPVPEL